MRRFSGRGRRFKRRRTVAWVPGLSTFDTTTPTNSRLVALARLGATNTWGFAIQLTDDTDLSLHGGEDAVLTRVLGSLYFTDGRVNSGAGLAANSFQLHVVIALQDITPTGAVLALDYTTSAGLGLDDVLWTGDVIVPSTVTSGTGTGMDAVDFFGRSLALDTSAKRKLTSGSQVVIWFQGVFDAASVTAVDFRLRGTLRELIMRPV